MYYIINKITANVNNIIYTPIGYVDSIEKSTYICNFILFTTWYDNNIEDIMTETLTINDWITSNPAIYCDRSLSQVCPDNIPLITDLDNPEGV